MKLSIINRHEYFLKNLHCIVNVEVEHLDIDLDLFIYNKIYSLYMYDTIEVSGL